MLSSSALSAWVDNSLLDLHNFSDDAQRYPIIENYNEIDKDDDNHKIMISIMIQISIMIMIMLMIMAVIFNKLIHAIHEFENFMLWLWKLCFS